VEFALDPGLLVALAAALTLGLARRAKPPRLRLELGSFPSRWRAVVATALLVLVVAVIVLRPIAAMVDPAEVVDLEGASFARLFAAHAVLAAFLLAWWALAGFPPPAGFLSVPGPDLWRRLVIGVGAGVAVWVLTIGTMSLIGGLLVYLAGGFSGGGADAAAAVAPDAAGVVPEAVGYLVGLSVPKRLLLVASAGLFEEAFFRSFLQPRAGLLLSTVLFTASHAGYGSPLLLVGVFVLSLALGRLFREQRDAIPCMVAHAVFDAIQLLVVLPVVAAAG